MENENGEKIYPKVQYVQIQIRMDVEGKEPKVNKMPFYNHI